MDLAGYLDLERSTLTRSLKPLMQKDLFRTAGNVT